MGKNLLCNGDEPVGVTPSARLTLTKRKKVEIVKGRDWGGGG